MKVIFVEGGPLDGQIRELPDGTFSWEVMEAQRLPVYVTDSGTTYSVPEDTMQRGRYERYVGHVGHPAVEAIAVPFVWQGWDRA